jgi:hypothetical protein
MEGELVTSDNEPDEKESIFFTEIEAAKFLKMTPRMLAERRRAGKISHTREGKYVSYTREQLEEFCRVHSTVGPAKYKIKDSEIMVVSVSNGTEARSVVSRLLKRRTID